MPSKKRQAQINRDEQRKQAEARTAERNRQRGVERLVQDATPLSEEDIEIKKIAAKEAGLSLYSQVVDTNYSKTSNNNGNTGPNRPGTPSYRKAKKRRVYFLVHPHEVPRAEETQDRKKWTETPDPDWHKLPADLVASIEATKQEAKARWKRRHSVKVYRETNLNGTDKLIARGQGQGTGTGTGNT